MNTRASIPLGTICALCGERYGAHFGMQCAKDGEGLFTATQAPSRPETSAAAFRKKPVVIEATQWFKQGDHPAVIRAWRTPEGNTTDADLAAAFGPRFSEEYAAVPTLEDLMAVTPGDWIITGVQGEHYPCKPDIFALTYEPAASGESQAETPEPVAIVGVGKGGGVGVEYLPPLYSLPAGTKLYTRALGAGTAAAPTVAEVAEVVNKFGDPEAFAEHDVRTILLKVVPGDGEGLEVYAKSVKDIEDLLARMGEELEEWQLGMRKLSASPESTMADAIAAGDGTLHGAIDHWQNRALAAEAALGAGAAAASGEPQAETLELAIWQGRKDIDGEGWTPWREVLVGELPYWRERIADEAPFELRPLYSRALGAGTAAAPTDARQSLATLMQLNEWRAALRGLCEGPEPDTAAEAAANVRRRMDRKALAQPAQAGKPLTGSQIIALRAAVPDGEWASRDEAEFFERGVKAAEKHHGIGKATGMVRDAARWQFLRDNHVQYFTPARHWILTDNYGRTIAEGTACSFQEAIDAAMLAASPVDGKKQP